MERHRYTRVVSAVTRLMNVLPLIPLVVSSSCLVLRFAAESVLRTPSWNVMEAAVEALKVYNWHGLSEALSLYEFVILRC